MRDHLVRDTAYPPRRCWPCRRPARMSGRRSAIPVDPAVAREAGFYRARPGAPYKGWDDLLDALALLGGVPAPHAVLAAVTTNGADRLPGHLEARIDALGLDATLLPRFDPPTAPCSPPASGRWWSLHDGAFAGSVGAYAAGAAPSWLPRRAAWRSSRGGRHRIQRPTRRPLALADAIGRALALTGANAIECGRGAAVRPHPVRP